MTVEARELYSSSMGPIVSGSRTPFRANVLRVAIIQEIAAVPKGTASLHGHVPGDLLHPRLVRVNRDPGDIHPAVLEVDEFTKVKIIPATRKYVFRSMSMPPTSKIEPLIYGSA